VGDLGTNERILFNCGEIVRYYVNWNHLARVKVLVSGLSLTDNST
jgi:hypothetical protein